MNDQSKEKAIAGNDASASRRNFMRGASLGVVGTLAATSAMAQDPALSHLIPGGEPEKPKGLGRRSMLDHRFPVCYQNSVPQGVSVLMQYFQALSERNLKGIADLVHFPFASFESIDAVLVKTPEDLLAHAPASMNMSLRPERYTDHDGYLKPGAYDIFEGLEVHNVDPNLCAMSMVYTRYGPDGNKLHRCEGIYTVTNNDGRWAIQAMSTIFTPAHMIGVVFQDTIEAAKRLRVDHDLAYQDSDRDVEPGANGQPPGSSLRIDNGGSPWNLGPGGKAMDQFKFKGVKSRISVTTAEQARAALRQTPAQGAPKTREQELADYADYRKLMSSTTGENWGWVYGVLPETRILHHTYNKAHRFSGAIRFTASGEFINTNTDLTVITYRKRKWAQSGGFAYTTPHDRSNDIDVPGPLYVAPPRQGGRGPV